MFNCGIIKAVESSGCFNLPTYISPSEQSVLSTSILVNRWADVFEGNMVDNSSGVYEIVNKVNGHRYVGSASFLYKRWCGHKAELRKGDHHSKYLQRAWNKYGEDAFEFNIIVHCPKPSLVRVEDIFIYEEHPEYNMSKRARSSLGAICTPEHRRNLSLSHMGHRLSEEHRLKLIKANTGNTYSKDWLARGNKVSEETRRKIGMASKGNKHALGRKQSYEERMMRSKAILNNPPNLKIFYGTLVSPDGIEYKDIINMSAFGREHGLKGSCLRRLVTGERKQHKGWRFIP